MSNEDLEYALAITGLTREDLAESGLTPEDLEPYLDRCNGSAEHPAGVACEWRGGVCVAARTSN